MLIAGRKRKQYLQTKVSFNQETTLAGKTNTIVNDLKSIHQAGYKIEMFYVGVDSSQIAIHRVHDRVR